MNKIICGDALTALRTLPDKCCRCCVTSPPYFNLRDYGVSGQIGLEPTMQEYIARLVEVFAEVKRALTDDGTLWVNIADSYAGSMKGSAGYPQHAKGTKEAGRKGLLGQKAITNCKYDLPAKNLMGIRGSCNKKRKERPVPGISKGGFAGNIPFEYVTDYRNKRSVWNMPTTSGSGKNHYATFPDELAVNCILAGTAEGDIVLDPFVGSGTTCRVANRYGRQYIGIDLNPEYCKAAEAEIPINLF